MKDLFPGTEPTTRIGTPMPDEAHLAALPPRLRRDGQILEITTLPGAQYIWRQNSIAPPVAGTVVVPTDIATSAAYLADPTTAPGRWENQSILGTQALPRLAARLAVDSNFAATRVGNTLTANANGAAANIDSKAPALGDRIFFFSQTAGADNGIYAYTSLGSVSTKQTLVRTGDMNNTGEVVTGMTVAVTEGNNYGGQSFGLTTLGPIVVNTTALVFVEKSAIITVQIVITLAQLQALGAVKTFPIALGANAVPPNARFRGGEVVLTPIDDAGHGTALLNLGWSGGASALISAMDVSAATGTGFPKAFNGASAYAGGSAISTKTLIGTLVTGANLNALTAGGITITAQFSVGG